MTTYRILCNNERDMTMLLALLRLAIGSDNCRAAEGYPLGPSVDFTIDEPTDRLRDALAAYDSMVDAWSGWLWQPSTNESPLNWRDL